MRRTAQTSIQAAFLILAVMAPGILAAQVSLDDQLKAQYTVVKMGADTSGPQVVEPGTVLKILKGGILSVPYNDVSVTPTKYQNGQIHSPNALVQKGIGSFMKKMGKEQNTHLFPIGDKVYPSRVDVNMAKDSITLGIIACDQCNNTNPPTYYKADVVFQFDKGVLAKSNAGQVEDVIAQVFAIDDSGGGDQGGGQGGGDQGGGQGGGGDQGGGQGGGGGQAQNDPPREPANIQVGESVDDVVASLGQPEKIVNLPTKKIYVYKDLKITFVKGKVSDVQ